MSRSGNPGWNGAGQAGHHDFGSNPRGQSNGVGSHDVIVLRLILNTEEVQYLFGTDEYLLGQLSQQTGANVVLSDPGSHERVLTISASLEVTHKAFSLVCRKLWEFVSSQGDPNTATLILRLAVHASQCGSIIGKQGVKIKEIRDLTGVNINVSVDSLPESNERKVEIIGNGEACLQTVYHVCGVLQDSPPKGEVVPYVPKSAFSDSWKPLFLANNRAYVIEDGIAVLASPEMLKSALSEILGPMVAAIPISDNHQCPDYLNPLALMSAISTTQREKITGLTGREISKEMRIENEVAGSVIGRGGTKVAEIRKISGAHVSINTEDEVTDEGERIVNINGTPESVLLAQFLVHSNIEMYKKDRGLDRMHGGSDPMDTGQHRGFHPHGGSQPMTRTGGSRGGGGFGRGGSRPPMEGNRRGGGGGPMGHQSSRAKGRRR